MAVEKAVREIPIDDNLPAAVQQLAAEGWMVDPEHPPKAGYNVYRVTNEPGGMEGKLIIDDSKIGILRDGKIIG